MLRLLKTMPGECYICISNIYFVFRNAAWFLDSVYLLRCSIVRKCVFSDASLSGVLPGFDCINEYICSFVKNFALFLNCVRLLPCSFARKHVLECVFCHKRCLVLNFIGLNVCYVIYELCLVPILWYSFSTL